MDPSEKIDPVELTKVYEARTSYEAGIVCNMLKGAGIRARVVSTAMDAARELAPFQKAASPIFVAAADAELARALLRDYEQRMRNRDEMSRDADHGFCYHCGEAVEPGQTPCPACSGPLEWNE